MRARHVTQVLAALAVAALLGAACGDDGDPVATGDGSDEGSTDDGTTDPGEATVYEGSGLVLQESGEPPVLCLGGVAQSLPPQCGGPEVIGWDWAAVDGAEEAAGVTWGSYRVVGTYDGTTFTLTEPAQVDDGTGHGGGTETVDFTPPCQAPDGGWEPVDPDRTGMDALDEATTYAQAQETFAGLWIDQPGDPEDLDRAAAAGEDPMDASTVLVVRFTGDLDAHEDQLRARWGGPLCVAPAERTEAELRAVQAELTDVDGMLWSSVDVVGNHVELGVAVDDGLQADLDERYGDGVVQLDAALRPVD